MTPSIEQLPGLVAALPPNIQGVFSRLFSVDVVQSILHTPKQMLPWVRRQFGSVEKVTCQDVVKVTNLVTFEGSLFNPLRSLRPHLFRQDKSGKSRDLSKDDDPFSTPLVSTTEDPFGRVEGEYCITAGNVASYEQYHCVVIFKNPDPLDFGCGEVADYIETGWRWMQRAHEYDPAARYGLFLWNCNARAGASIPHGHAQVVLGRGSHYARVEQLRQAAFEYKAKYSSDYFDDLFKVHEALGLGFQAGDAKVIIYLSPLKLNEVMILAPRLSDALEHSLYRVLACFRDRLGVKSFNLGITFPPLDDEPGWEGFPLVTRMLDRGNAGDLSSDIGAMEFWGASVISSDPFETAMALRAAFKAG